MTEEDTAPTSQPPPSKCTVIFPPSRPSPPPTTPSIVLYGTWEPSPTQNWTATLTTLLSHLPLTIYNPRNPSYHTSPDWRESIDHPPFKAQVDWELDHAAVADVIVFYFKPGSASPVSLLELGLCVGRFADKVVCCVPEGFYKKGNVEVVCGRMEVKVVRELEELAGVVEARVEEIARGKMG